MMKHAYLILAHNEFDVLAMLVNAIDDSRNDIFIHFDSKVKALPALKTTNANLYILEDRVDVRWGDVSVVHAEYLLFEKAFHMNEYNYYHLLSGVDFPLKSQDEIHAFCIKNQGKEFIGFYQEEDVAGLDRKVNRYHFFAKDFRYDGSAVSFIKKIFRATALRLQLLFGMRRNVRVEFKKGTQWISITHPFVNLLLNEKQNILKIYRNSFCADEIFIQTLCWNSVYKSYVFDLKNEAEGSQRMIGWQNNVIKEWKEEDFTKLINSELLFARKFSSKHLGIINKLNSHIRSNQNQ